MTYQLLSAFSSDVWQSIVFVELVTRGFCMSSEMCYRLLVSLKN